MSTSRTASVDWELWSTTARLVVTSPGQLAAARLLAETELDAIDRAASRFRDDSEISTLGRDADGGVRVSPILADLLRAALDAAELTDGAVDPTVGRALEALGYDRDIRLVARDGAPVRAVLRPAPGWRTLRLEGDRFFRPDGVVIDLGASAKAVAADRVARVVSRTLGTGALISLGGDVATAGLAPRDGWQVAVQDLPADPVAHLGLSAGAAVATSSTVRRTWRQGARTVHHVVDPATGRPAGSAWRSVSVVAPTCAEANAWSTAALVRGLRGPDLLRAAGRPARLVAGNGQVVLIGGWPEERAA